MEEDARRTLLVAGSSAAGRRRRGISCKNPRTCLHDDPVGAATALQVAGGDVLVDGIGSCCL